MNLVRDVETDNMQHLKFLNNIALYTAEVQYAIEELKEQYSTTLSAMETLVGGRLP